MEQLSNLGSESSIIVGVVSSEEQVSSRRQLIEGNQIIQISVNQLKEV